MEYLAVFYLVTHLIRDERDFREMYLTMVIIATVLALHGIWQFIIGVPIPASWTDAAEGAVRTRVYSIFSNPNIMGAYMILFAPMTIGLAYACERPSQKVLFWLCGLAMCAGCLFTMSRGAWLALAIAAVLFALLIDRRLLALMLVCGAVACTLPFVRSRIGYLFTPQFADSNARGGRASAGPRPSATSRPRIPFSAWAMACTAAPSRCRIPSCRGSSICMLITITSRSSRRTALSA